MSNENNSNNANQSNAIPTPSSACYKKKGTKEEVYNGLAECTPGGLIKGDLIQNKRGKVVSKKKSEHGQSAFKNIQAYKNKKKSEPLEQKAQEEPEHKEELKEEKKEELKPIAEEHKEPIPPQQQPLSQAPLQVPLQALLQGCSATPSSIPLSQPFQPLSEQEIKSIFEGDEAPVVVQPAKSLARKRSAKKQ